MKELRDIKEVSFMSFSYISDAFCLLQRWANEIGLEVAESLVKAGEMR